MCVVYMCMCAGVCIVHVCVLCTYVRVCVHACIVHVCGVSICVVHTCVRECVLCMYACCVRVCVCVCAGVRVQGYLCCWWCLVTSLWKSWGGLGMKKNSDR